VPDCGFSIGGGCNGFAEVEHGVERAGMLVEGVGADTTGLPVVLDEPQDRGRWLPARPGSTS
jgi:hypothetical protein